MPKRTKASNKQYTTIAENIFCNRVMFSVLVSPHTQKSTFIFNSNNTEDNVSQIVTLKVGRVAPLKCVGVFHLSFFCLTGRRFPLNMQHSQLLQLFMFQ